SDLDAKKEDVDNTLKYSGYLEKMSPYHVRHILVKVGAQDSALYDGKITEAEAKKLANVGQNLALGDETFGALAQLYSEDTGSAEKFGDLGIMSVGTSFINEFKLGVYAYEGIYNTVLSVEAKDGLEISDEMKDDYLNALDHNEIATIPYEAFLKLQDYSEVTKDEDSFLVNEGNEFFYPRNVIFNKYFNRHDVSVVTPNKLVDSTVVGGAVTNEDFAGEYDANYAALPGFQHVDGLNLDVNGDGQVDLNDKVLTTKSGKVILAVRGGSSGDSGYQGFHFISVERSAFEETVNGVSLSEYYTTYYPGQNKYPVYTSEDPQYVAGLKNYKPTYVNFLDQQVKDYKARAESVEGEIKGFDNNLKYYIYEKLVADQKIKFNEELTYVNNSGDEVSIDLNTTLANWISVNRQKADYDTRKAWEENWHDYVEFLEQQKALRVPGKLLSEVCAKEYELPEGAKTDALWIKGGACYNDK
ncbi:MAG: peptidylprolyl isomerase, partial [Bacilli bacterium]|nr:peptidylprolyl isomerase [Bacilli bacterium]